MIDLLILATEAQASPAVEMVHNICLAVIVVFFIWRAVR